MKRKWDELSIEMLVTVSVRAGLRPKLKVVA